MNEYFTGQIVFELHSACNAHLAKSSQSIPFEIKIVEENVAYL